MPPPQVAPRVVRRIDRLARRAHAFHRFAHHPLCGAYAAEVLHLGRRTRLCRGCSYVYGGAALGAVVGGFVPLGGPWPVAMLTSAVAWLGCTVALRGASAGARPHKLASRGVPGFIFGWGAIDAVLAPGWPPLLALAVAALGLLGGARAYRRRGPDRSTCEACPEFAQPKTCRGFAPIVRRERAFMRLASRWLTEGGPARAHNPKVRLPLAPPSAP